MQCQSHKTTSHLCVCTALCTFWNAHCMKSKRSAFDLRSNFTPPQTPTPLRCHEMVLTMGKAPGLRTAALICICYSTDYLGLNQLGHWGNLVHVILRNAGISKLCCGCLSQQLSCCCSVADSLKWASEQSAPSCHQSCPGDRLQSPLLTQTCSGAPWETKVRGVICTLCAA